MSAYVYKLTHTSGQFYFGFRSANKHPPHEDLFVKYFSSSRAVKALLETEGASSFDTQIILIGDPDECYWREQRLIKEHIENPMCLNKTFVDPDTHEKMFSMTNRSHSSETRMKMSAAAKLVTRDWLPWNTGGTLSEETKQKISATKRGKRQTPEHRAKVSVALKGKPKRPFSDQHRANLKAAKARSDQLKRSSAL